MQPSNVLHQIARLPQLAETGNPPNGHGEYIWKLVATTGLRAEWITQIGQNVDPVWERATGNHEAPIGVGIDATGLYRVGATNEGAHYAVKTDLNGRHLWAGDRWSADPWAQGTRAVTLVQDRLFELLPNGDLYGYDTQTGRVFTGGNYDPKPWNLCWNRFKLPEGTSDDQKRKLRARECPHDLAGDSDNGLLVAAYPQYNAVSWFNARDGQHLETASDIPKVSGIACGKQGRVYAITPDGVVSFTRDRKLPQIIIPAAQLENPWRLTVERKTGDLLVAENSFQFPDALPHHQVKRFNSQGQLIATYGKSQGRIDGVYRGVDFRGISDIEADPEGGFVVTEGNHTPPRRTARFDARGQLVREWLGAQHYGVLACPEPHDPRFVWTLANAPHRALVRWEVDYQQKSWRVAEIYQDLFTANLYANVPSVPHLFERNGRIYIQGGALEPLGLALAIYDPQTKTLRPCVASGKRDQKPYLWCDRNDDGRATDDEIQWLKHHRLGGWIDPSTLTLYTTPAPTDYAPAARLEPAQVTSGGTPIYSEDSATKFSPVRENGLIHYPSDFRVDGVGNLYGCFAEAAKNPQEGAETHGAWYYNSCSAIDRLVKWDHTGRLLWSVGRHSPDADHETGSTAMARGLVGLTHNCVIWGDASDEETARPTVWTEDGLYIDELLRVPTDSLPKEAYGMFNANEYPCGRLHTNPETGEVLYFALNSGGGAPIYRITGWDGWHRQEGTITLRQAATAVAKRSGTGLTGEYFNTPDCSGQPVLVRVDPLVYFNWGKRAPASAVTADTFSVRWTGQYETATNEEVRFEVRGSFPWRDRGRPLFTKLWLNGKLMIDSTQETNHVRVRLTAGQRINLRLECGFKRGEAAVALSHDTPMLDRRAILPEFLHPESAGATTVIDEGRPSRPAVLAHFSFDSLTGPLSWSSAGGDIFGRLTGIAKPIPGVVGSGVELHAQGDYAPALFPIDEQLQLPDSDYGIAFWFKTAAANTQLCEAKRYSSYNNRWSDHRLALVGGKLEFRLHEAETLTVDRLVNDNQWHHVVSTVGQTGQKLYLDGQLVRAGTKIRRVRTSNRLGLDVGPGPSVASVAFDEIRCLGREPTQNEVSRLFAANTQKSRCLRVNIPPLITGSQSVPGRF